jgi:hypothetical protein
MYGSDGLGCSLALPFVDQPVAVALYALPLALSDPLVLPPVIIVFVVGRDGINCPVYPEF